MRGGGRPCTGRTDNFVEWTSAGIVKCKKVAQDHRLWRTGEWVHSGQISKADTCASDVTSTFDLLQVDC